MDVKILKETLTNTIVEISFIGIDGELVVLPCTNVESMIPASKHKEKPRGLFTNGLVTYVTNFGWIIVPIDRIRAYRVSFDSVELTSGDSGNE